MYPSIKVWLGPLSWTGKAIGSICWLWFDRLYLLREDGWYTMADDTPASKATAYILSRAYVDKVIQSTVEA